METSSQITNILLGFLSLLSIISGFLVEEYKFLFWSVGSALAVVVVLGVYVFEDHRKIIFLINKFQKIEESLNIYNRLNKLELRVNKNVK